MKIYDTLPPLIIRFVNEMIDETVQLTGEAAKKFVLPRVGEHFHIEVEKDNGEEGRTNIVEQIHHDVPKNEISIYYEYYLCLENTNIKRDTSYDDSKVPKEEF